MPRRGNRALDHFDTAQLHRGARCTNASHRARRSGEPVCFVCCRAGIAGVSWCGQKEPLLGEISYWTAATFRGQGYAPRALRLMTAWGFRLGLIRLQLAILVGNTASERVAEKAGSRLEGTFEGVRRAERRTARHDPLGSTCGRPRSVTARLGQCSVMTPEGAAARRPVLWGATS